VSPPLNRCLARTGHDSCPLCGSSNLVLIDQISVPELVLSWKKAFQIDISSEVAGTRYVELFACRRCHLQFYAPPTVAGSSRLYSELQKYSWYYTPVKWEHEIALHDLKDCQEILEIGCGAGEFIARAHAEKRLEVRGIETNQEAAQKARQLGLPVEAMELQQVATQRRDHYDAVCAFQVLEHVFDPKEFLECSCTLLKSGGWLILGLPNAESFLKYQFNVLEMPPHHMTKWSEDVLRYIPSVLPLRLIGIRLEPLAEYHVAEYVKALCRLYATRGVPKFFYSRWVQHRLREFLKVTRLRKLLVGHTLYAKFQRV
jgi:SAM-dependent methyltransferase